MESGGGGERGSVKVVGKVEEMEEEVVEEEAEKLRRMEIVA